MHVSELWIYPIKSCRGVRCESIELGDRGPLHDRRWMLVDETGRFISQRTAPKLALVNVVLEGDALAVSAPGMPRLRVAPPDGRAQHCTVWDDQVALVAADTEWFSEYIGEPCRLMYMPDDAERVVDRRFSASRRLVSLADAFPLLLIGQGSLDLLNSKLEQPVPMQRFRPNIVVEESEPHAEDTWKQIRIGAVTCSVVKPCARCAVTTVDFTTGEMGREPLQTLARYRKQGSKVLFGQNVIHEAPGSIHAGDPVSVVL